MRVGGVEQGHETHRACGARRVDRDDAEEAVVTNASTAVPIITDPANTAPVERRQRKHHSGAPVADHAGCEVAEPRLDGGKHAVPKHRVLKPRVGPVLCRRT